VKIFQWNTTRTLVMGVLNVTPDSFSDGGKFADVQHAVAHAREMAHAGADIIDIGGESTRPGAEPVSAEEELRRVIPVVVQLAASHPALLPASGERVTGEGSSGAPSDRALPLISVDTTKAVVAEAALAAGARIVNDISALRFDGRMVDVVREHGAGVVLMHMLGTPQTMQNNPQYADVVADVRGFLQARIAFAIDHGIEKRQIAIDPGIGFGKTVEDNLKLLAHMDKFQSLGCAVMVGTSRKAFIGKVLTPLRAGLNREQHERLWGTAATVAWAVAHDANVVRVHDVTEIVDVVRMIEAVKYLL
jgi:dihydropteroate synthase